MTGTVAEVLDWIARSADADEREKLARYGIPDDRAAGIAMKHLIAKARSLGTDMDLARGLWASGGYEARTIAAMVTDPAALTPDEMDAWAADFDSWAICDTVAFRLFDRTPHAWGRIAAWIMDERTLVRRAGYATLWAVALHDKGADAAPYLRVLDMMAARADDAEPIVMKAVDMALGAMARRATLRPSLADYAARLAGDPARARLRRMVMRAAGRA